MFYGYVSTPTRTSLARKLAAVRLAVVAVVTLLAELLVVLATPADQLLALEAYEDAGLLGVALVLALALTWRWQRRERQLGAAATGAHWHARLTGRFGTAPVELTLFRLRD